MDIAKNNVPLNFPLVQVKLFEDEKSVKIWDTVRQKQLLLTPEEWVRQHVVHFLIDYQDVPKQMIAIEKQFKVGKLHKRFDVAVYDNNLKPLMLVECKAPQVKINQKTIEQILRYNLSLQVNYLFITNGLTHYTYRVDYRSKDIISLPICPNYQDMMKG